MNQALYAHMNNKRKRKKKQGDQYRIIDNLHAFCVTDDGRKGKNRKRQ
jgi:hypothetical protein